MEDKEDKVSIVTFDARNIAICIGRSRNLYTLNKRGGFCSDRTRSYGFVSDLYLAANGSFDIMREILAKEFPDGETT